MFFLARLRDWKASEGNCTDYLINILTSIFCGVIFPLGFISFLGLFNFFFDFFLLHFSSFVISFTRCSTFMGFLFMFILFSFDSLTPFFPQRERQKKKIDLKAKRFFTGFLNKRLGQMVWKTPTMPLSERFFHKGIQVSNGTSWN